MRHWGMEGLVRAAGDWIVYQCRWMGRTGGKELPQGLKPGSSYAVCGTAEQAGEKVLICRQFHEKPTSGPEVSA
jgi:hypothetical protein